MIPDDHRRRTRRSEEQSVLPALREAFSQRPEGRRFSAHQISVVLSLHGYLPTPPTDFDVEAAPPFALADREGAA